MGSTVVKCGYQIYRRSRDLAHKLHTAGEKSGLERVISLWRTEHLPFLQREKMMDVCATHNPPPHAW